MTASTRKDGRQESDIRTISSDLGVLSNADGSARMSFGNTSVLASVSGPMEVRLRDEQEDKSTVEMIFRPVDRTAGVGEKHMEELLRNAFASTILTTLHPRTLVQIVIQVEHDDGAVLACAANAVQLALMDAGIQCKCMVAAMTACIEGDSKVLIDPSSDEILEATSTHTFAFANELGLTENPLLIDSIGEFTEEDFDNVLSLCHQGAMRVQDYFRTAFKTRLVHSV